MPNALASERSLYLRQHAENPVDWIAWSPSIFERAKQEDKLVFISIGYSACHWCHVMEHESFEDEEVAAILNQWFIPVKVDREEHPDVDAFYMGICQALTGYGGWPLTIVTTPDNHVIVAGTYFPKHSTRYRIGLVDLLTRVHKMWVQDREHLLQEARSLMEQLRPYWITAENGSITRQTCQSAVDQLKALFDTKHGGFGNRPKFPMAASLWYLLLWGKVAGDPGAVDIVTHTLEALRLGGIYDHVGYGFHRYSTDERWFLPHYEKMLYDQALLLMVYAEAAVVAHTVIQQKLFRRVVEEVVSYLEENLQLQCGAYATSEDADTTEGEGAYYRWRYDELKQLIPPDQWELFLSVYSVTPEGNASSEASGAPMGDNILHAGITVAELLDRVGMNWEEFLEWWDHIRPILLEHRSMRVRPARDDKVLCNWNALAIAALARAGRILNDIHYVAIAERIWNYLRQIHAHSGSMLYHSSYDFTPSIEGVLEDYAFVVWGLLELYQATGNASYLREAQALQALIAQRFSTPDYVLVTSLSALLPAMSDPSDGATLSGIGISAYVAASLGLMTQNTNYTEWAYAVITRYGGTVMRYPSSHTTMLIAYLLATHGIALSVRLNRTEHLQLNQILTSVWDPLCVVCPEYVNEAGSFLATVCSMNACSSPLYTLDELERYMKEVVHPLRA